jgi:hypothetical protein
MRSWFLASVAAVSVALSACAPGVPAVSPGAPVTPTAMTLVQTNHNPPPKLIQIAADGLITGPNGQPLGKIAGTKIVDDKGKELVSISPDGTIVSAELTRKLKFNEEGDLSDEKGLLKIGNDGTVITQDAGGDLTRTPMKFEGYTPAGRRAAEIVLVLVSKHLGNVTDLGL